VVKGVIDEELVVTAVPFEVGVNVLPGDSRLQAAKNGTELKATPPIMMPVFLTKSLLEIFILISPMSLIFFPTDVS